MLKQLYNLIIKLLPYNLLVYSGEDVLVCYDKTMWIMSESKDAILLMKKNINGVEIVE